MLSALSHLVLAALLLPSTLALLQPTPVDAARPAVKCPSTFGIYLGRGNDAANRTWWFRDFGVGAATRLSAVDYAVSGYRLQGTDIVWAGNASVRLHSWADDARTYIMATDEATRLAHYDGWGEHLRPIVARINAQTCVIDMHYRKNRFLQRYGFNVHLTPDATGGQIQWPAPTARPVPAASLEGDEQTASVVAGTSAKFVVPAKGVARCEENYYGEPCPGWTS